MKETTTWCPGKRTDRHLYRTPGPTASPYNRDSRTRTVTRAVAAPSPLMPGLWLMSKGGMAQARHRLGTEHCLWETSPQLVCSQPSSRPMVMMQSCVCLPPCRPHTSHGREFMSSSAVPPAMADTRRLRGKSLFA